MFIAFEKSSLSPLDKSLQISIEDVNKNYRLLFEKLYGKKVFKNHPFRKELSEGLIRSPRLNDLCLWYANKN